MFGPSKSRRPWTPDDDDQLRQLAQSGKDIRMIAAHLKRTKHAIKSRLTAVGISLLEARAMKTPPPSEET
jgi:hypothetical protein